MEWNPTPYCFCQGCDNFGPPQMRVEAQTNWNHPKAPWRQTQYYQNLNKNNTWDFRENIQNHAQIQSVLKTLHTYIKDVLYIYRCTMEDVEIKYVWCFYWTCVKAHKRCPCSPWLKTILNINLWIKCINQMKVWYINIHNWF